MNIFLYNVSSLFNAYWEKVITRKNNFSSLQKVRIVSRGEM